MHRICLYIFVKDYSISYGTRRMRPRRRDACTRHMKYILHVARVEQKSFSLEKRRNCRNIWDVSQFWQWEISSHLVDFYLDFYLLDLDLLEEPSGVTYGFDYIHGRRYSYVPFFSFQFQRIFAHITNVVLFPTDREKYTNTLEKYFTSTIFVLMLVFVKNGLGKIAMCFVDFTILD